ncbi:MAG: hypothetical protein JW896_18695 [Deltaproteobacteria bacterium]|nr:hypothetical protein [Deltaproteobacteria bacterium]
MLAVLCGCAATSNTVTGSGTDDGFYHPKLPVGIETLDAAIKDLAGLLENRQDAFMIDINPEYFAKNKIRKTDYENSQSCLKELQEGIAVGNGKWTFYPTPSVLIETNGIAVRDDMLEVSFLVFLLYSDLPDLPITANQAAFKGLSGSIHLGKQIDLFMDLEWNDVQRAADDLFFIQQNIQKYNDEQTALFETQVARYRSMEIKPTVSEEQKKYIVQANSQSKKKEYKTALALYRKAVEVDPVSYPEAYFNMALLSAQMHRFKPAISYMKKYLMLEPNAKDARNAQDKIYEWEFMLTPAE